MAFHPDIQKSDGALACIGKFALAGIALNLFAIVAIGQVFFSLGQGVLRAIGLIKSPR